MSIAQTTDEHNPLLLCLCCSHQTSSLQTALITRAFFARSSSNQICQLIRALLTVQLSQQLFGKVLIRLAPPPSDEVVPDTPALSGLGFRYESSFRLSHIV